MHFNNEIEQEFCLQTKTFFSKTQINQEKMYKKIKITFYFLKNSKNIIDLKEINLIWI